MYNRLGNSNRAGFEVSVGAVLAFKNIGCRFSTMILLQEHEFQNCIAKDTCCSNQSKLGDTDKAAFEEVVQS